MFNAPRPALRYGTPPANGLGGSFVDDPLAISIYDDPWSATPSPPPIPTVHSAFSSIIADPTVVPALYHKAFAAVDVTNTGEVSISALSRVLATSSLPAATIDRVTVFPLHLTLARVDVRCSDRQLALALAALAQSEKDISIEQVAALAAENNLPIPVLNLDTLQPSTSTFSSPYMPHRQSTTAAIRGPTFGPDDLWDRYPSETATARDSNQSIRGSTFNGWSSLSGTGLPSNWWNKQETVERADPVHRRYSEFVFLWDCLVRRYPFRLLPGLPPKRVQPDAAFLEQRRKGLARFLNAVINHPVMKEDGLLAVFLSEPSLETWRKHTPISLEEEAASKRVDEIEEMSIPSDLEEKIAIVRGKINPLIEQWQRICILAERMIKRRESAAVRVPPSLRRTFLPAHFALPLFSSTPSLDVAVSAGHLDGHGPASSTASLFSISMLSTRTTHSNLDVSDEQADLARLTNVLRAIAEVNERCWRGDDCELCEGVRQGLGHVASHTQRQSDLLEQRTDALLHSTLESLKQSQRDLYIAMRDLLVRHDKLAVDNVDRLKKRIDSNSIKLESIKAHQREGWQEDADRVVVLIEKDQSTIASLLNRRVFIRAWWVMRNSFELVRVDAFKACGMSCVSFCTTGRIHYCPS
ncbi:hypothetical protein ID866_4495 [Astraeus odoratus]|nr:hypothetical protein ID866_4495 [Astraeus odoratus]